MSLWLLVAAIAAETRKLVASPVPLITTILLVLGVAILSGSLTAAALGGNEQILAQLGPMAEREGWSLLTGVTAQIVAAAGLLGFGVVLSWMIGREFAEKTITGLFALPVSRLVTALAKLLVYLAWSLTAAALLVASVAVVGIILGLGSFTSETFGELGRQFVLAVLSALLAIPCAWVSTLGRGLLPGIGTVVVTVVMAQVAVVVGAGAWFPVAAPALWATEVVTVSALQLSLVAIVPVTFGGLTLWVWKNLQLDR